MADSCCASACGSEMAKADPRWRRVLWVALIVNAAMFLVEMVAGAAADSRALQADALDFLGDAGNYAVSLAVVGAALSWRARAALLKSLFMLCQRGLCIYERYVAGPCDDGRGRRTGAGRECWRCPVALSLPYGRR